MKNLTKYYTKKNLPLFIIILSITVIFSFICVTTQPFTGREWVKDTWYPVIQDTGMEYLTILMIVMAVIFPIYEFIFKMRKNSCDLFYSLPVKRHKLYLFKYLFGLCELLIIFLANFLIISTVGIIKFAGKEFYYINQNPTTFTFNPGFYYLFLLIIVVGGILIYSWVAFFFTRGNTIVDGIINIGLSSFVIAAIIIGTLVFLSSFDIKLKSTVIEEFLNPLYYIPYVNLYVCCDKLSKVAMGIEVYPMAIFPTVVMATISIALIPLFVVLSKKERAEDTGDITDSPFSYKVFLPIFIISLFVLNDLRYLTWIAVIVGGYIGYVVYNRNFRLRKNDIIVFVLSVGVGFMLMCIKLAGSSNSIYYV